MTPRKMIFRYRLGTVHYYSLGGARGLLNQLKHFRNVALPKVSLSETYPLVYATNHKSPPPKKKKTHKEQLFVTRFIFL